MNSKVSYWFLLILVWYGIDYNRADNYKAVAISILRSEIEEDSKDGAIQVTNLVQEFHSQLMLPENEENILKQERKSRIIRNTLRKIKQRTGLSIQKILKDSDLLKELKQEFTKTECKVELEIEKCRRDNPYRTFDGSCNNLANPSWGMSGQLQLRMLDPVYHDGISDPRIFGVDGTPLPSPRSVSNTVHKGKETSRINKNLSVMVMQWGQFLDHDLTSTPTVRNYENLQILSKFGIKDTDITNHKDFRKIFQIIFSLWRRTLDCCGEDSNLIDEDETNGNQTGGSDGCFSIRIPSNDLHFNGTCMAMARSAGGVGPDCDISPRKLINRVTSYIDASNVYGSSQAEMKLLRGENGLLKSTDSKLLPQNDHRSCVTGPDPNSFCQLAGDERVNENPSLGSLHTLFMREHNRIATKLRCLNPDWDADMVFNEARKIVAAVTQHITYSEYLPVLLGRNTMKSYGLTIDKFGHVDGVYSKKRNAGISVVFSTAAFRVGHSSIPSIQGFITESDDIKTLPLEKTFHRPSFIQEREGKGFEENIKWIVSANQPRIDRFFVPAIRDSLFLDNQISMDLVALNINRGRDHGLPSYNDWRRYCKLPIAKKFKKLKDHNKKTKKRFEKVYRTVDDIDVYSGGVSEKLLPGAEVGPLFACLLGEQFKALKMGDRFWYERKHNVTGFTEEQLASIKDYSLAKVICENTGMNNIQRKVMFALSSKKKRVKCQKLSELDLTPWKKCNINTDHC